MSVSVFDNVGGGVMLSIVSDMVIINLMSVNLYDCCIIFFKG